MTPSDLRSARKRLGMTQAQLAQALKLGKDGSRAVRRWESGEREISGPVQVAVELMLEQSAAKAQGAAMSKTLDSTPALALALRMAPGISGDRELFEMQSKPWQEHWIGEAEQAIRSAGLISREVAARTADELVALYNQRGERVAERELASLRAGDAT